MASGFKIADGTDLDDRYPRFYTDNIYLGGEFDGSWGDSQLILMRIGQLVTAQIKYISYIEDTFTYSANDIIPSGYRPWAQMEMAVGFGDISLNPTTLISCKVSTTGDFSLANYIWDEAAGRYTSTAAVTSVPDFSMSWYVTDLPRPV